LTATVDLPTLRCQFHVDRPCTGLFLHGAGDQVGPLIDGRSCREAEFDLDVGRAVDKFSLDDSADVGQRLDDARQLQGLQGIFQVRIC
jgi:hypothetical protein